MPKAVERRLRAAGRKKHLKGDDLDDFVYGTMTEMAKRGEIKWKRGGHSRHRRKRK